MGKKRSIGVIDSANTREAEAQAKILAARRTRIAEAKIDFIPNKTFAEALESRELQATILGPVPLDEKPARKTKPPSGLPPYLAALYEVPLLTREQESHLFRKMNYLRFLAADGRDHATQPFSIPTLDKIDRLLAEASSAKNQITQANLRLVVSIAKRHVSSTDDFFELVSDGNMSLIRAVEKFDYARGNKFSTYATWAITKNFARSIPTERVRASRFTTGLEDAEAGGYFEQFPDLRGYDCSDQCERLREAMKSLLRCLDDRERRIIIARFGLDGSELTLEQLGRELGITKERVRQIETRAHNKLKKIARAGQFGDITDLTEGIDD